MVLHSRKTWLFNDFPYLFPRPAVASSFNAFLQWFWFRFHTLLAYKFLRSDVNCSANYEQCVFTYCVFKKGSMFAHLLLLKSLFFRPCSTRGILKVLRSDVHFTANFEKCAFTDFVSKKESMFAHLLRLKTLFFRPSSPGGILKGP